VKPLPKQLLVTEKLNCIFFLSIVPPTSVRLSVLTADKTFETTIFLGNVGTHEDPPSPIS